MEFSSVVTSRNGFIKLFHLLSKGLSLSEDGTLEINILGGVNTRKSLVADTLVVALDENRKNYVVPVSNKMCFESVAGGAIDFPACGYIRFQGKDALVRFVRQDDHMPSMLINMPDINIFVPTGSDNQPRASADMVLVIEKLDISDTYRIRGEILSTFLQNDKMQKIVDHINEVNLRKIARLSEDPTLSYTF